MALEATNQELARNLTTCLTIRSNLTELLRVSSAKFLEQYGILKNRSRELQSALSTCEAEASRLAAQHKVTLEQLKKTQAQLSEVETDLKQQQQAASKLRVELEKAKALALLLTERLRAVEAKRQRLEAELALEREKHKGTFKAHQAAMERLKKELLALEAQRDKLVKALAAAKEEREKIAAQATALLRDMEARGEFCGRKIRGCRIMLLLSGIKYIVL